ncbi:MAG: hypothetical protein B6242_07205 [Anaerolineaceae bacterium 4572_78]|nr:MAG: hypothetical protein B6242_07205 [Anaerolineaceae bacterium 4572_78]
MSRKFVTIFKTMIVLFVLMVLSGKTFAQDPPSDVEIASEVTEALQDSGDTVRVIIALKPPDPNVDVTTAAAQIAVIQASVIAASNESNFKLTHQYKTVPALAGEISVEGLEILKNSPHIQAVDVDMYFEVSLTESVNLIQADKVQQDLGKTGAGVNVAVLDTGVDSQHHDLTNNIIAQKCFGRSSCPPNNTNESDYAQDENGHGTHVAGIITSPNGVAPDAGIVAVRVLNASGGGWASDIVAGIDWVTSNRHQHNIRVLNMSLTSRSYTGECDMADANTQSFATALRAAEQVGITVFAASGNEGYPNRMGAPACISSVISVGSVYDTNQAFSSHGCSEPFPQVDQVSCFSNANSELDLLAPGSNIISTKLGGGTLELSGTSMASPHAAGVAALILQTRPSLSPYDIENTLKQTGKLVTDNRNGIITPRINALAAVESIASPTLANVGFEATTYQVPAGDEITTNIIIQSTQEIANVNFTLGFDTNMVRVVESDSNAVVTFASTEDSYLAASIVWQGLRPGQTELNLSNVTIQDEAGNVVPYQFKPSILIIETSNTIFGQVQLQGRNSHECVNLILSELDCIDDTPESILALPNSVKLTTEADGYFKQVHDGNITYTCLNVVADRYLMAQHLSPQGYVGKMILLGGDMNQDNIIDIFDLTLIATDFRTTNPDTDINGDGIVDIMDLALVAGNYKRTAPLIDWQ